METLTINTKRPAENVGRGLDREYADYLINGFKQKFPKEKSVLFIAKETIIKALEHLDDVSGIRFMYGYESVDNNGIRVLSRVLVLIPCNTTNLIPNSIILPKGYITHNGTSVSFEKTKQILYNHAVHFARYFPDHDFNKVMRGAFMDINTLLSLLDIEDCTGINFNFGYDDSISDISLRNKPVFEAINFHGDSNQSFDFMPCPPWCDSTDIFNVG